MRRLIGLGVLACVVALALVSTGCNTFQQRGPVGLVDVYVVYGPGIEPVHRAVKVSGYPTVLDVTRSVVGVAVETNDRGEEWPVVIEGAANNLAAKQIWRYELNNGFPSEAPNLKHAGPGDVIVWRLQ